ncbi:uncharacterized protein LOC116706126 isoform X2 [Etheostoma spectabile]|uniref:uncharacterized protein LOC116706126 isoform X2 n=1 Tax=Etheostoma spectabile TaxID=54343 RepID=UPI0013AE8FEF|nr:uncharacterized protein LOC116706126 isoform X2 [Etheostoma spectabile]
MLFQRMFLPRNPKRTFHHQPRRPDTERLTDHQLFAENTRRMAPLELILIFLLQFEGISGRDFFLYKRPRQDAVLSCTTESSSPPTCSIVEWFYNKDGVQAITVVRNGEVIESSARAARLRVTTDCSLVINNVTAEDVGQYTCRQGRDFNADVNTYLSVLTISPSQPGADPNRDDDITLKCSLLSRRDIPCRENSIRWVDETGAELLGEGDGYRVLQQTACVSFLTVKRQSGRNRKYTCQFVDEQNSVKIEADYTPDLTDPTGVSPLRYVMLMVRVAGLILMIVITVIVIRSKWNTKPLENDNNVNDGANVQYENVEAGPAAARPQ